MVHLVVGSTFGHLLLELLNLTESMLAPVHQMELEFIMLSLHLSLEMTTSVNRDIQERGGEAQTRTPSLAVIPSGTELDAQREIPAVH